MVSLNLITLNSCVCVFCGAAAFIGDSGLFGRNSGLYVLGKSGYLELRYLFVGAVYRIASSKLEEGGKG